MTRKSSIFQKKEIFRVGIRKEKPAEPDETELFVKTNRKRGKLSGIKSLSMESTKEFGRQDRLLGE